MKSNTSSAKRWIVTSPSICAMPNTSPCQTAERTRVASVALTMTPEWTRTEPMGMPPSDRPSSASSIAARRKGSMLSVLLPVENLGERPLVHDGNVCGDADRDQRHQALRCRHSEHALELFFTAPSIALHPARTVAEGHAGEEHVLDRRRSVLHPPARRRVHYDRHDRPGLRNPGPGDGEALQHGPSRHDDEFPRLPVRAGRRQPPALHKCLEA